VGRDWALIPGRASALIDTHSIERKLAAIFAADVEGYSRLMGRDEVGTLRTLTSYRVIIDRLIGSHRGRIFSTAGDSLVADFASAVDAVQCAVAVQDAMAKENADRLAGEQMRFRIGVHVGDIIVQGDNLFGDAVNVAARLEQLAEPGTFASRVLFATRSEPSFRSASPTSANSRSRTSPGRYEPFKSAARSSPQLPMLLRHYPRSRRLRCCPLPI
jgi:class 3 adenylate cyclase